MRLILATLLLASGALAADIGIAFSGDPHVDNNATYATSWNKVAQWVVDNKAPKSIGLYLNTGDVAFWADQTAAHQQFWSDGSGKGLAQIDALDIPYMIAWGNHDRALAAGGSSSASFDTYVGHDRISGKSWYGGYWTADPNGWKGNQWLSKTTGTRTLAVMALECSPRQVVLDWAGTVIAAHPSWEWIILTHVYLMPATDGTFLGELVTGTVFAGGLTAADIRTWALTMPQIRAVFCGHVGAGSAAAAESHRTDTSGGATLHGFLNNYQDAGSSYEVTLLTLHDAGTVTVQSYDARNGVESTVHPSYTLAWATSAAPAGLWLMPTPVGAARR